MPWFWWWSTIYIIYQFLYIIYIYTHELSKKRGRKANARFLRFLWPADLQIFAEWRRFNYRPWWTIRRHCRRWLLAQNSLFLIGWLHHEILYLLAPLWFAATCAIPVSFHIRSCFLLTFQKGCISHCEILMGQGSIWFRWVPRRTTSVGPKVICSPVHQVGAAAEIETAHWSPSLTHMWTLWLWYDYNDTAILHVFIHSNILYIHIIIRHSLI